MNIAPSISPLQTAFWDSLPFEDKAEFLSLRDAFHTQHCSTHKDHTTSSFQNDLQAILSFIERRPEQKEIRSIVSGVCFAGNYICVNTRQLKYFIGRCKSSINNGFQQLGYVSAKTKVRHCIITVLPSLLHDTSLLRQWTMRCVEANSASQNPNGITPSSLFTLNSSTNTNLKNRILMNNNSNSNTSSNNNNSSSNSSNSSNNNLANNKTNNHSNNNQYLNGNMNDNTNNDNTVNINNMNKFYRKPQPLPTPMINIPPKPPSNGQIQNKDHESPPSPPMFPPVLIDGHNNNCNNSNNIENNNSNNNISNVNYNYNYSNNYGGTRNYCNNMFLDFLGADSAPGPRFVTPTLRPLSTPNFDFTFEVPPLDPIDVFEVQSPVPDMDRVFCFEEKKEDTDWLNLLKDI